jgi:hypothetical protein
MNWFGAQRVIIMSVKDHVATLAPEPGWLAKIRAKAAQRGTNKMSMSQINRIVAEVRASGNKKSTRAR